MTKRDESTDPAVLDFIQDFEDDVISGTHRPLGFYLKRYPEAETQVAVEYLRRRAATDEEAERAAEEVDGERIGRYRIVGALGQGGQGMVYEAVDDRLGRRVALKLLQGRLITETRRRRFQREAEILARIDHHAIAEVLDADFDGEEPFIAMRFVPGTDLAAQVRSARAEAATVLPVAPSDLSELHKVLRFFEGAAHALEAAHGMGVVHRDVKPGNLMVRPDREPVVLDFGLATGSDDEALTRAGEGLGTPEYMAPEQIEEGRGPVDARTDVYGLGVSLYEVLTGARPFQGASPHETQASILRDTPPPVDRVHRGLGRSVAAVVSVAMDRDPARRYGSAHAFAEDLRRLRTFEPIMARPPGPAVRLKRWAQRQPALAASLAGVFLAITAALLVALHGIDVRDGLIADKNDALREKTEALDFARSRLYLARAEERLEGNPSAALALAEYADRLYSTPESRSALFAPLLATRLQRRFTAEGAGRLFSVAMSPAGDEVAGVADEDQLWIWPVGPGAGRRVDLPGDGHALSAIRWLDERGGLVVGSTGGTVHLVRDGSVLWSSDPGPAVGALSIDRDAQVVLVTGEEGTRALDLGTGAPRWSTDSTVAWHSEFSVEADGDGLRTLRVHGVQGPCGVGVPHPPGEVTCSAVSADGSRAAVGIDSGRVFAWSTSTGKVLVDETGEFIADGLEWGPAGLRLLLSSESRNAYLWRAEPLAELFEVRAAGPELLTAEFVDDGSSALLVDQSGLLQLIATPRSNAVDGAPSPGAVVWEQEVPGGLSCASSVTPSGHLLTVSTRGEATLWRLDPEDLQLEQERTVDAVSAAETCALSLDGAFALLVAEDGLAHLWEPSQESLDEVEGSREATAHCLLTEGRVALGQPDGRILITGGLTLPPPFDNERPHPILTMALSPDGRRLAACYLPTIVAAWDLKRAEVVGERVRVMRTDRLVWSDDSRRVAVGSKASGPTCRIVDVEAARSSPRDLPFEAGLMSAAFARGSEFLVAGAKNGGAYLFGSAPEPELIFGLHSAPVTSLCLDRERALSSDERGRTFLWPISPSAVAAHCLARPVDDWEQKRIDGSVSDG
ncbi:MAG: protein kinase [Planctomycetes bacterium]|nr:protein kinase [Planctomycetota bacterium]